MMVHMRCWETDWRLWRQMGLGNGYFTKEVCERNPMAVDDLYTAPPIICAQVEPTPPLHNTCEALIAHCL